jgi:hypothetical protein
MRTFTLLTILILTLSWDVDDICPNEMPDSCPEVIKQVCGWRGDGTMKTFDNPCYACKDKSMFWWDWGTCSSLNLSNAEIDRRTKLAQNSRNNNSDNSSTGSGSDDVPVASTSSSSTRLRTGSSAPSTRGSQLRRNG